MNALIKPMAGKQGFTVIELVMVIVLVGMLSSVIAPVLVIGAESMLYDQVRTDMVESARYALDRTILEAFRINQDRGVIAAAATGYEFEGIDVCAGDGSRNVRVERVGNTAQLNLVKCASAPLSMQIDNFQFAYHGWDGRPLSAPIVQTNLYTDIKTVRLLMRFSDPALGAGFNYPYGFMTEVRPKNLHSERSVLP